MVKRRGASHSVDVSACGSAGLATGGRILAIDYGRRRMGLALSDPLGVTAQPLETLERRNRRDDLRRLREVIRQNDVRHIVVGHPVHLDGTASEMGEEVERFAARLGKHVSLPVELVDERLTSWEAEQISSGPGQRRRSTARRGDNSDSIAAALILREYLERASRGRGSRKPGA